MPLGHRFGYGTLGNVFGYRIMKQPSLVVRWAFYIQAFQQFVRVILITEIAALPFPRFFKLNHEVYLYMRTARMKFLLI